MVVNPHFIIIQHFHQLFDFRMHSIVNTGIEKCLHGCNERNFHFSSDKQF